ncbi:MAG: response regulator [Phycisphaeraceae bacterium]|nr:response regulator [Phycisphaeraceae bacterium]
MDNRRPLILLVDDETHILHVLSLRLNMAGYETLTAENGQEALDLALHHTPDLIIADYQMPLLDGLELCRRLKAAPQTADIPALMLTARGFGLHKQDQLKDTNIQDVISKPFSPRDVLLKVKELAGEPSGIAPAREAL